MQRATRDLGPPAVVPVVDGFRGIAALLVVVYHCCHGLDATTLGGGVLRAIVASGHMGVDFFFVLSGFVLFLPVVRQGGEFGSRVAFFRRRVARIVPAYYASLLALVIFAPLVSGSGSPLRSIPGWANFLAHLLFLQQELMHPIARLFHQTGPTGFEPGLLWWTLSNEALFYALLPFVAGFLFRRPLLGLGLGLATSVLWRAFVVEQRSVMELLGIPWPHDREVAMGRYLTAQLPAFAGSFALGMSAAWLLIWIYRRRDPANRKLRAAAAIAQAGSLVAVVFVMYQLGRRGLVMAAPGFVERRFQDLLPSLPFAALLLASALSPPICQWPFRNPVARWLGDVSYGVYLWHGLIMAFLLKTFGLKQGGPAATALPLLAIVTCIALVIGWLSRRFIEEPAIAWAKRSNAERAQKVAA